MIRSVKISDASDIAAIYNHYVETSTITFEENPVSNDEMVRRIQEVSEKLAWYVFESDGRVLGYAYATPWRARSAYRFSVETTVYVCPEHPRKGIGSALYKTLIDDLRKRNIRVILGGIAQPNEASVLLHESLGFERVAYLKDVGYKFEKWVDVGYWQLRIE